MNLKLHAAALLATVCMLAPQARAEDDANRAQRWSDLRHAVFANRPVLDGSAVLTLQAPARADDAALVPMEITARGTTPIKGLYLIIDDNPAPVAAHFTFGPDADPRDLHLRVRVDQYTLIHAVAEAADGKLYAVATFVKASGGCSAPSGADATEALRGLGEMKFRLLGTASPGQPVTAQLLIRHPNFNGMQMDQVTRLYTPARYIDKVDVTYDGVSVFHLDSDISMSSDPAITFSFRPQAHGELKVVAHDTKNAEFVHSFDLPAQAS
jgi:sulfur-oxidizing protein SoxY